MTIENYRFLFVEEYFDIKKKRFPSNLILFWAFRINRFRTKTFQLVNLEMKQKTVENIIL